MSKLEFPPSNQEMDVDMSLHDDTLMLQYGGPGGLDNSNGGSLMGNGMVDAFLTSMIPGVSMHQESMNQLQHNNMETASPSFSSVEEYAALMGIKLEPTQEEMTPVSSSHLQPTMNTFNVPDPAKIQANAAYFEHLYRERVNANPNGVDLTSMTLPAGIGSGLGSSNLFGISPANMNQGIYDRATELSFHPAHQRMFDPSSAFNAPRSTPVPLHPLDSTSNRPDKLHFTSHPLHDIGAQTLSPELLSAMQGTNNQTIHKFETLSEDDKLHLSKEEKSRERNRDHSRKSRLRKKEYVENLKLEVAQLQIYQQICEHNQDLVALVSSDGKATYLYSSGSYLWLLGYQPNQIVSGEMSFMDLVHPDAQKDVQNVFTKLTGRLGECMRFRFRIRSMEGQYYDAETAARVAERGIVCSTRVDRDN